MRPALLSSAGCAQGRKNHCVAVIGDGAITGGMAYEAMNHAGFLDKNMIVVLNDNQQVRAMGCGRLVYEMGSWEATTPAQLAGSMVHAGNVGTYGVKSHWQTIFASSAEAASTAFWLAPPVQRVKQFPA